MPMEKRNVVETRRTPAPEIKRADADWDKQAAAEFAEVKEPGNGTAESARGR